MSGDNASAADAKDTNQQAQPEQATTGGRKTRVPKNVAARNLPADQRVRANQRNKNTKAQ